MPQAVKLKNLRVMRWAPESLSGTHSNCLGLVLEEKKATAKDFAERLFLSLRELEACTSTLLAVLLSLLTTRIAGNEAF